MENQVQETGLERLARLRKEARDLGIVGTMTADKFQSVIDARKAELANVSPVTESQAVATNIEVAPPTEVKHALTAEEAAKIDARLKYEEEAREKFRREREIITERAGIVAESEVLGIEIDLPEKPTELQLARARQKLGIEKREKKPSPETLAIEASKRNYYIFMNREQEDAAHTVNLGGKYIINLIPDQIHVLSECHVRFWKEMAVTPVYERKATGVAAGPGTVGKMVEECVRTGGKPRFMFEYIGEAPQDAPFGLVTDMEVLNKLRQPV